MLAYEPGETISPSSVPVHEVLQWKKRLKKLYRAIELTPVYVCDTESAQYKLCGNIDSELAIDAETGELLDMESLN